MTENRLTEDDLRLLADSARDYAEGATALARVRDLRGTAPGYEADALSRFAALGWTAVAVPERCGGAELPVAAAGAVLRALGTRLAAEPLTDLALVPASLLSRLPQGAPTDALLSDIAQGTAQRALAWSESHAPDPALAWHTRATRNASGFTLQGTKRFVPHARDGWLVTATTPDGLAVLRVDADADGLQREVDFRVDGVASDTLVFDGTPATLLACGDTVPTALAGALDDGALLACAEMLGVMATALDTTLDYIKTRTQFGQTVASFQAVQHRMVDLHILHQMAISSYEAGVQTAMGNADALERAMAVSQAKARCSDAVLRIAQDAVQYHGAIGFTDECDIGLYLKRALVLAPAYGNATFHRARFRRLLQAQTTAHEHVPEAA